MNFFQKKCYILFCLNEQLPPCQTPFQGLELGLEWRCDLNFGTKNYAKLDHCFVHVTFNFVFEII